MGQRKQDHYGNRARKEGYPARSVYKLEEIQKRSPVLRKGARVLDIGAAPGSWSMFAAEKVKGGSVVAVDLKEFSLPKKYHNVRILQGDAFSEEVKEELSSLSPFDVILSDAAPSTTGNKTVDTARSEALVEQCMDLAFDLLAPGGNLVVKLFQGGEEKKLIDYAKRFWKKVKPFKPSSSRKESFELFIVALGFRPEADSADAQEDTQ